MAILFDEVDDQITIADSASLTLPDGDWSVGILVRITQLAGANYNYVIGNGNYLATPSFNVGIGEQTGGADQDEWFVAMEDDDGTGPVGGNMVGTSTPGADGKFRWVFVVRDAGLSLFYLYIMAIDETSPTLEKSVADTNFNAINGTTWRIGTRGDEHVDRFFGNYVNEFFIMTGKALTAAEITKLVRSQSRTMVEQLGGSNVKCHLTFDDAPAGTSGDAVTFTDKSGNGNDGTGSDGGNNTGLTMYAEGCQSYPSGIIIPGLDVGIGALEINVSDSISITESISFLFSHWNLSISDTITIAENNPLLLPYLNTSLSDSITTAESQIVSVNVLDIYVSESISIAEDSTLFTTLILAISDSVTIYDPPFTYPDIITIAEDISVSLISYAINLSVSDSISITEDQTLLLPSLNILLPDSISITEDISVSLISYAINLSVFDSISITEDQTLLLPFLNILLSDSISVTEDQTLLLPSLNILLFDSINIAENISFLFSHWNLSLSDSIGIVEYIIGLLPVLNLSVFDSISITEDIATFLDVHTVSKYDSISITEDISIAISILLINIYDSISITDTEEELLPALYLSIDDSVNIAEDITTNLVCYIDISESISVAENIACKLPIFYIDISESISVAENITRNLEYYLSLSEDISITEDIASKIPPPFYEINLYDSISIIEDIATSIGGVLSFSISDSITITDIEIGYRFPLVYDFKNITEEFDFENITEDLEFKNISEELEFENIT